MSHSNFSGILSTGLLSLAAFAANPEIPQGEDPLEWREKVEAFELEAQSSPPPSRAALFVGSSSIRLWDTLEEDMAPMPVIKRGFGGSRLFDSVYWADSLVLAHDPAVIVMFSGTNDLKGDEPKSAERVCAIIYIAISPTKKRIEHLDLVHKTNRQIASFCESDDSLYFLDTASGLLNDWGYPDMQWFDEDELHLNPRGHALWTSHIKPLVARLLEREG